MDFQSAKKQLGTEWLAVYSGCISRQSPGKLRDLTRSLGAEIGISLACSAKPWENTTILTDGKGFLENFEINPSPENAETNLCFSNLVWVTTDNFNPKFPFKNANTAAFFLEGYWKCQDNRENYLLTVHEVLCSKVAPWPHSHIPAGGVILCSLIPENTLIRGTLWVGNKCSIENDCILENCVILDGAHIGSNSNLRNCLVMPGTKIPRNTVQYDKYLSLLGDDNGRED